MRSSFLVLALTCALLVPVPALAQSSRDGPSGAQYEQYGGPGMGGRAVQDAIVASGALRASAEDVAEEDAASAAEVRDESTPELEELPDTGGPSPWWLCAPLLCAGGLLIRGILPWRSAGTRS